MSENIIEGGSPSECVDPFPRSEYSTPEIDPIGPLGRHAISTKTPWAATELRSDATRFAANRVAQKANPLRTDLSLASKMR